MTSRKHKIRNKLKILNNQKYLQAMSLLGVAWLIIFVYLPIYGITIAFKDYNILKPVSEAPWVGFKYFIEFFESDNFFRVMKNTLGISFWRLVIGFPLPIIFALFLNELRSLKFKRIIQTVSYLPHFISWVVLGGILMVWLEDIGLISTILVKLGIIENPTHFLAYPEYFWGIVVTSDIWKEIGWRCIIYISAVSGINIELYESATMDGAGRFRKMWNITLPGIRLTISVLLILTVSRMLESNFEQIFVLRNSLNSQASETIDIYVYNVGIRTQRYSLATAIGVFRSFVALLLLLGSNEITKKLTDSSLF